MAIPQVAFVPETQVARARLGEGALSGLSFAAKDVFAVRGHVSSAGHPTWLRTHGPAERDAAVVERLRAEGADLVGVTILDELAYSLSGENPHYGTPENPRAPGRLCGGSSCGSAAAVAAAMCDFAIATDTAGSVRVPAAFTGLFGLRPTHGALSTEGVVPLAPSFDTVGFFAREAQTFQQVATRLLGEASGRSIERVLIADDALSLCDAGVAELLEEALDRALKGLRVRAERTRSAPEGFAELRQAFRRLQAREVWHVHGAWVESARPAFSPQVAERFAFAREIARSDDGLDRDLDLRDQVRERLAALLTPGTLLFVPPTPGVAPRIGAPSEELETTRARLLELTALASLSGLPQLVVPVRDLKGPPLALSFLASRGEDASLAQLAGVFDGGLA